MNTILIAGASGMIGNVILDHCLSSSKINKVTSLVLKESNNTHSKLKEEIIEGFTDFKI
jgi:FlaA1/EpsC-like NDP-sugar epimerase